MFFVLLLIIYVIHCFTSESPFSSFFNPSLPSPSSVFFPVHFHLDLHHLIHHHPSTPFHSSFVPSFISHYNSFPVSTLYLFFFLFFFFSSLFFLYFFSPSFSHFLKLFFFFFPHFHLSSFFTTYLPHQFLCFRIFLFMFPVKR